MYRIINFKRFPVGSNLWIEMAFHSSIDEGNLFHKSVQYNSQKLNKNKECYTSYTSLPSCQIDTTYRPPSAVAIEWFRSLLLVSKQTILTQPLQYQAGQEEYFNKET